MREVLIEDTGTIQFYITFDAYRDASTTFKVEQVISWNLREEPIETEVYLTGSMKWDGCTNIDFGGESCLHLCGYWHFKKHYEVLEALMKRCSEVIIGFDKKQAGYEPTPQ
jgi:hypothetical protein